MSGWIQEKDAADKRRAAELAGDAVDVPADITVRLRRGFGGLVPAVCDEAANEIDRLRAKLLRRATNETEAQVRKDLADAAGWITDGSYDARSAAADLPVQPTEPAIDALFELAGWPEGGDIDAFAFQDWAVKYGYLTPETRTEPCGEGCFCVEYHGEDGFEGGVICYRRTHPPVQPTEPLSEQFIQEAMRLAYAAAENYDLYATLEAHLRSKG